MSREATRARWDAVSTLLAYPDDGGAIDMVGACHLLEADSEVPSLAVAAKAFRTFVESTEPTQREELFTTVFDINPQCTLELGWHLYGEDYKRGSFLVDMRKALHAAGVEETAELPDHMIHVLRVLGRLPTPKDIVFSTEYIQPALAKMLEGYDDPRSAWHPLLHAVLETLEAKYGETQGIVGTPSAESQGPYEAVPCESLPRIPQTSPDAPSAGAPPA